jgi:hypothetical protein
MSLGKHSVKALVLALVAALHSSAARAAYDYTILGGANLVGGFSVSVDGTAESGILVGGIAVTGNLANTVPGYQSFTTVCVDLNGRIYLGSTYAFNEVGFTGQSGLNPLWGQPAGATSAAYQAINNAAYLSATFHPTTATDWAALQLAVWKAVYDTTPTGSINWNTSTERFNVTTDVNNAWAEAQGLLNDLPRNTDYAGYLLQPTDATAQELLVNVTPVPVTPVPEYGTILTGALMLLPFAASTLRIVRKKPTL